MARTRVDVDADQVPEHTHAPDRPRKPRRGRRLAVLLALAGGVFYLVRRNQRRAQIDEGVWHEAPTA